MKHSALFVGILFASSALAASPTSSQSVSNQSGIAPRSMAPIQSLNFLAGIASSSLSGNSSSEVDTGRKSGMNLSASADIETSVPGFIFEPGIAYRQQGAKYSVAGFDANVSADIDYLAFPVAAKFVFPTQDAFSFFAKGGLAPAFAVSKSATLNVAGSSETQSISDGTNTFDIAILVGAGAKYTISPELDLMVEAGYWKGLLDVATDNDGASVTNNSFGVSAGVAVKL